MGYHVSIVRTQGGQAVPIRLNEAKALLLGGADWEFLPEQLAFVARDPGLEDQALWFHDGELWTKSPSTGLLAKMIDIAKALDARVRGDELETYQSTEVWYTHPDDAAEIAKLESLLKAARRRTVRNQWCWRIGLIVVPLLAGLAYRLITRR